MLISFIIPAYNRAFCIDKCIDSVICFIGGNWNIMNIVVVDDASTDNTFSILVAKYIDLITLGHITVIQNLRNKGTIASRVEAAKASNAKFVGLIDSDNLLFDRFRDQFLASLKDGITTDIRLYRCADAFGNLYGTFNCNPGFYSIHRVINTILPECFGVYRRKIFLEEYFRPLHLALRRFESPGFFSIITSSPLYLYNFPVRVYLEDVPDRLSTKSSIMREAEVFAIGYLCLILKFFSCMNFRVKSRFLLAGVAYFSYSVIFRPRRLIYLLLLLYRDRDWLVARKTL